VTGQENERLAVLETHVSNLVTEVAEIKKDVKALLASRSRLAGMGLLLMQLVPFVALGVSIFVAVVR